MERSTSSPFAQAQGLSRLKLGKEIDVETYFVPSFLKMLGYRYPRDIQNAPALECPEYYIGTRRRTTVFPDHLVLAGGRKAFVLEVKKPSVALGKAQIGQVLSYALHPDIQTDIAVLTNGRHTIIIHVGHREPILKIKQEELPARLPDLQLLLGRKSLSRRVGELVIEKRKGSGGFGTVYQAWNITLQRYEALKIYHPEIATRSISRRRLVNGLRAQARLNHQNIAKIYQIQSGHAEVLATMEYSSGVTFDKWIRTKPSARQKIQLLSQIARAIQFAHENNIVHRDLKPSNILVERHSRSWRSLIVDFDTAVAMDATSWTQTSDRIGTLGFMAPEMFPGRQSSNKAKKRSPHVDVYALGALAFYAFFGIPPQGGPKVVKPETLVKRLQGLKPGQARKLVIAILRAMDPEPGIRQGTALLLSNDLEEALSPAQALNSNTEQEIVEAFFHEADRLLSQKPLSDLKKRRYERSSQFGRLLKVPGFGDLILMHDFDHRELMTGLTFSTTKQFTAFLDSPVIKMLRRELGKSLIIDPPNPWEEGGAYVMWRLSEMRKRQPKALAQEAVDILSIFYRCMAASMSLKKTNSRRSPARIPSSA